MLAITLHEAAHGYVAKRCGDDTAWQLGRVSFNPLKHIDTFGTLVLPALLLVTRAPFLFGYAKPVPVRFDRLRKPRRDMIAVAAAGPGMNFLLAAISAVLVHAVWALPPSAGQWVLDNLAHSIELNVVLALFNLIPLPPLDGGRIAVGLLPDALAAPLSRVAPYGMSILIGVLIFVPLIAARTGGHLDLLSEIISKPAAAVMNAILVMTGTR